MTKVDLVTGFLGAGKTTFIRKYADYLKRNSISFAVIENEFGAPGVDSALLKSDFNDIVEIAGGCICCTMKTGFHEILSKLSGTFDRIIVEPSGIFDADSFFEVINSPDLVKVCQPGMFLTLVDPHTVDKLNEEECGVLTSELANTGCVLWTKTDIEPPCDMDKAKSDIKKLISKSGVYDELDFFPIPSYRLEDEDYKRLMMMTPILREHNIISSIHPLIFQSTRLYTEGVYDLESINLLIDHITSNSEYGNISRIKGFLKSTDGMILVNCTVSDRSFQYCDSDTAMLNIIGRKLNRKKLAECLEFFKVHDRQLSTV